MRVECTGVKEPGLLGNIVRVAARAVVRDAEQQVPRGKVVGCVKPREEECCRDQAKVYGAV